jgi:hypothetical protein
MTNAELDEIFNNDRPIGDDLDRWAKKAAALLARIQDDDLRLDLRFRFEERAAICEHDGRLRGDEAERVAFEEIRHALATIDREVQR